MEMLHHIWCKTQTALLQKQQKHYEATESSNLRIPLRSAQFCLNCITIINNKNIYLFNGVALFDHCTVLTSQFAS